MREVFAHSTKGRAWILLAAVALAAAGCAPSAPVGATGSPSDGSVKTLKIGVMAGYTGAIPVQSANTLFAANIAADEINGKGGIKVGAQTYKFEIVPADDKCDASEGQLATDRLISVDKVDFLVGGQCSAAILAALPTIARSNIVALVTNAASDQINKSIAQNSYKNIFHYSPSEISMNTTFGQFIGQQVKPKSVALIAEDTDPGHDAASAFASSVAKSYPAVKILSTDYVRLNAGDMLSELAKIKAAQPDLVFWQSTGVNSEAFAKQSQQVGLRALIASDAVEAARTDFQEKYAAALEGAFVNVRWAPAYSTPLTPSFLERFKAKAARDADFFALQEYDAILVLADALTRAGTTEAGAVVAALEKTNLQGAMGVHSFEPLANGHRGVWNIVISQLQSAKPKVVFPSAAAEAKPALPSWFTPGP